MKTILIAALFVLSAAGHGLEAAGPPPPSLNEQGMPWFMRPQGMPGMPWFYRPPAPARPRQCRVAVWYPARYWYTDEWGHTVTWVQYTPQYVCD
jgi:hypothetical protein